MALDFENALVTHCAPTLAGIKPASLFQFRGACLAETRRLARHWNEQLTPHGLRVRILKRCHASGSCLVYVYRPEILERLLRQKDTQTFLREQGYPNAPLDLLLSTLSRRLCLNRDFPHEIGIFLGYPLADVTGFIENKGQNYTCVGSWKSYGDPVQARAYFDRCRQCTEHYCRHYQQGVPLLSLTVAA